MAITYSVRISGGGIDSFLGFEYCDVITLASREFRVLLAILPSLRCLRIFGFVWVAGLLRPHLSCLHSRFTVVRSFSWGFSLVWRSSGLLLRLRRLLGRLRADSSASLAQCCRCGGFFPSFVIFHASLGTSALS